MSLKRPAVVCKGYEEGIGAALVVDAGQSAGCAAVKVVALRGERGLGIAVQWRVARNDRIADIEGPGISYAP